MRKLEKVEFYGKKRIIRRIILVIIALFVTYSVAWYFVTHTKYDKYLSENEYELNRLSTISDFLHPFYSTIDELYVYGVAYPRYPAFTGNLVVSLNKDDTSLFIWPGIIGETTYGLALNNGDTMQLVEIEKDLTAKDKKYQELVNKYQDEINELFDVAHEKWGISF